MYEDCPLVLMLSFTSQVLIFDRYFVGVKNYFAENSARRKTPTHLTSSKFAALDHGWDRSRPGVGNSMSGTHHLKDKKICSPPLHRGI